MALNKEVLLAAIENETDQEQLLVLQLKLDVVERLEQNRLSKINALQVTKTQMENAKENNPATERYAKVVAALDTLINQL